METLSKKKKYARHYSKRQDCIFFWYFRQNVPETAMPSHHLQEAGWTTVKVSK